MRIDFLVKSLFGQNVALPENFYLPAFAVKNGLSGWFYRQFKFKLNEDSSSTLKMAFLKTFQHNSLLINEWKQVAEMLNQHRIPFELIKGMRSIDRIYTDPGDRAFSDIDVLIKNSDYNSVQKLLINELRYEQQESLISSSITDVREILDQHYPQFIKGKVVIEFHRHLNQSLHNFDLPVPILEKYFGKPEFEYLHFFFVLSHAYKHLLEGKFQFKFLADIVFYEKQFGYFEKTKKFFTEIGLSYQLKLIELWQHDIHNLEIESYQVLQIKPLKNFIEKGELSFGNINAYKRLNKLSLKGKILYLFHYVFPDKEMIINNFKPKNKISFLKIYFSWAFGRIKKGVVRIFKFK